MSKVSLMCKGILMCNDLMTRSIDSPPLYTSLAHVLPSSPSSSLPHSARLRLALGIGPTAIPPYVHRMHLLGYPPGYRLEAEEEGLILYDSPDSGTEHNSVIPLERIDGGSFFYLTQ